MFKIGQTVVHLTHGVGIVKSIETREFSPGNTSKFLVLEIKDNGAPKKVFVAERDASQRLRNVISKTEAKKVLAVLRGEVKDTDVFDHQTWNRRYREYMDKIHTGDIMEIARVLVSLRALQADKDLSFGERKLMDQALSLIRAELEAVEGLEIVFT